MAEDIQHTNADTADELRLKGNAAYKAEKLNDALELYTKALSLSERDTKILSNISATKYELGDYQGCIEAIDDRLKNIGDDGKNKKHQLLLRRVKCYFYLKRFDKCAATMPDLHNDPDFASKDLLKDMLEAMKDISEAQFGRTNKKLLDNFPFYKQSISMVVTNYDAHAHDLAEPVFTKDYLQQDHNNTPPADLSFFFAGIGDVRHFYATLFDLSTMEKDLVKANTTIRATLVDINPGVLAQNLIVFKCLHESLKLQNRKGYEAEYECLLYKSLIWYTYCSPVMPDACYGKMWAIMEEFMAAKTDAEVLRFLPWVEIDVDSRNAIRGVFDKWLTESSDGKIRKEFNTYKGIELDTSLEGIDECNDMLEKAFPLIRKETEMFKKTITILPPGKMLKSEPELDKCFRQKNMVDMRAYMARHWKNNVTRSGDYGNELTYPGMDGPGIQNPVHRLVDFIGIRDFKDIFETPETYSEGTSIDAAMLYFSKCAEGIKLLGDTVKIIVGDANEILLSMGDRKFDAIYLSNVPEYTGGYLTQTICAGPRLKPSGYIRSRMLKYSYLFKSIDHSLTDNLAVSSLEEMEKFYGLAYSNCNGGDVIKEDAIGDATAHKLAHGMKKPKYIIWSLSDIPAEMTMPRVSDFNRLMFLLFFKITMPSAIHEWIKLRRPLTMLSFLYVLQFFHQHRRIPAHWIDGILESILSGSINTSARPPPPKIKLDEDMMSIEILEDPQFKKPYPVSAFCTLPFVAELEAALVASDTIGFPGVYERLLPKDVESYALSMGFYMPPVSEEDDFVVQTNNTGSRVLALVFLHPQKGTRSVVADLRAILHRGKKEEAKGVLVYSCFRFMYGGGGEDGKKQTCKVIFSLSKGRMDRMKKEGWKVGLWRTDLWKDLNGGVLVEVTKAEKEGQ